MFAVHKAINCPPKWINALKKRSSPGTLSSRTNLDLNLLNVPKIPKPQISLNKTIETISAIEESIVIMGFAAQDLQAPL